MTLQEQLVAHEGDSRQGWVRLQEEKIERADSAMEALEHGRGGESVSFEDMTLLYKRYQLLTRQASKARNLRRAVRQVTKALHFIKMERDMLRVLHDRFLRLAVDVLGEQGFIVPEPKDRKDMGLPTTRDLGEIKVPCGERCFGVIGVESNSMTRAYTCGGEEGKVCLRCQHIMALEERQYKLQVER